MAGINYAKGAWSEAEHEIVKAGAGEGLSASQISRALGNAGFQRSRNAVIGYMHRAGVQSRTRPSAPGMRPYVARPRAPRPPRMTVARVKDVDAPLEASRPCTTDELDHTRCKWPLGDPATEAFRHCGASKERDDVYCLPHKATARTGAVDTPLPDPRPPPGGQAVPGAPEPQEES